MGILEPGAAWFTDKMPLNEMQLGLIALLFPEAPLVHVIRHPLDVMVSAISNHFTHGFFCSSALETAALHYVRVMDLVPQPSPHFFSCDSKAVGLDAKSPRHLQREAGPTDRVIPRVT